MNFIVTKLRNRLGIEKANKLIYIYMNQRVLDQVSELLLRDQVEKSDKDQVELEDLLLAFEAEDDDGTNEDIELDEEYEQA